jgi:hypothetical protein
VARAARRGGVSLSHNYGTNIFVHRNGRRLMVFHQAAAIPEAHAANQRISRKRH